MVSAFEGNPKAENNCLTDCVDNICDDEKEEQEMLEALDGRVYD